MFNTMFHMINKRALVEIPRTLISLNFYLFQNNFVLEAPNGFNPPKKIPLGGPLWGRSICQSFGALTKRHAT